MTENKNTECGKRIVLSEDAKCWILVGMLFVFCLTWNIAHFW